MDKPIIIHDKTGHEGVSVHRLVGSMQEIHRAYGLWICSGAREGRSKPSVKPSPRYFEFYNLSHLIDGSGWFWSADGCIEKLRKGQGILVSPGFIHDYGGDGETYVEDSICFTGMIADSLMNCGIIKNGILNIGSTRRLEPILQLSVDPAVNSQIQANIALQNLLIDLFFDNQRQENSRQYSQIYLLLSRIQQTMSKWWTVGEMADFCNLSEAQFRRKFHDVTGMAPKAYLDRLKINQAAELLINSSFSITETAERLGYLDPFHFSRRFKQIIGVAPDHYRRQVISYGWSTE